MQAGDWMSWLNGRLQHVEWLYRWDTVVILFTRFDNLEKKVGKCVFPQNIARKLGIFLNNC